MQLPICVKAKAKINLFLNLIKDRPDGFHEVRFVMQTLELADLIEVKVKGEGLNLDFNCTEPDLSGNDNLIVRAYHMFYIETGLHPFTLKVMLTKNIPVQAGLGGGSSDAAAMLSVLNNLHKNSIEKPMLESIASKLGSDVPFFLTGGTCIAEGRGEKIKPLPLLPALDVVLLKPKTIGVSTAEAFTWMRKHGKYKLMDFTPWADLLDSDFIDVITLGKLLYNDFEEVVFTKYPQLAKARQMLIDIDLPGVLMSGSGPTLFGLMDNPALQWPEIEKLFKNQDWFIMHTSFSH